MAGEEVMSEQYCGNCAHFDALHPVAEVDGIPVCRCLSKYSSLEPEVGSRINLVLVSAYCNCSMHGNAFEVNEDLLTVDGCSREL
jgi:hypothetical protein